MLQFTNQIQSPYPTGLIISYKESERICLKEIFTAEGKYQTENCTHLDDFMPWFDDLSLWDCGLQESADSLGDFVNSRQSRSFSVDGEISRCFDQQEFTRELTLLSTASRNRSSFCLSFISSSSFWFKVCSEPDQFPVSELSRSRVKFCLSLSGSSFTEHLLTTSHDPCDKENICVKMSLIYCTFSNLCITWIKIIRNLHSNIRNAN